MAHSLSESYGTHSGTHSSLVTYVAEGKRIRQVSKGKRGEFSLKSNIKRVFKDAFLPQGYPESVSEDYLAYQTWDTLQAFCSYITGTLATQAVLKGVGVGDSTASPAAATITWLLKDGLGMIGRILFAWSKGTDLDCNAKQWRLVADVLNDVAMFFDLLAPLFSTFFMLIVCLSSITRSIVGVAGGATRAALVQHQARRDNMADVSAKDGSQETIVNLVGLVIGMILTPLVSGNSSLVWILFVLFTVLHLYFNYQAVSVVIMENFNQSRIHLLVDSYLSSGGKHIENPKLINAKEPVIKGCPRRLKLNLGSSLSRILQSPTDFTNVMGQLVQYDQEYVIKLTIPTNTIDIAFSRSSAVSDQLKAIIIAEVMEYITKYQLTIGHDNAVFAPSLEKIKILKLSDESAVHELVDVAMEIVNHLYDNDFPAKLQKNGWNISHHLLGVKEWRFDKMSIVKMN